MISYDGLLQILMGATPSTDLCSHEEEIFAAIPEAMVCKGFSQNNEWHIYDVWDHILHVVDGVPANPILRMAAFFHDLGKPETYTEDSAGVGHFFGHWEASRRIFHRFAKENNIDPEVSSRISNLILYHDINPICVAPTVIEVINRELSDEDIELLFLHKYSDLMAQNPKFHAKALSSQAEQKEFILKARN